MDNNTTEEKKKVQTTDLQKPEKLGPEKHSHWQFIWEVAKVVIISLAIIIPVRYFLVQPFYVKGASMEPNFHQYEYLIIDEISYRFHPPQRGDVVVIRNPQKTSQFFIKRVIGLPGETVEIKNNHVYINGNILDESAYLDSSIRTLGNIRIELQKDQWYALGDNREHSLDSRIFGPIGPDKLVGRTWLRAWPLKKLSHFKPLTYPTPENNTSNSS